MVLVAGALDILAGFLGAPITDIRHLVVRSSRDGGYEEIIDSAVAVLQAETITVLFATQDGLEFSVFHDRSSIRLSVYELDDDEVVDLGRSLLPSPEVSVDRVALVAMRKPWPNVVGLTLYGPSRHVAFATDWEKVELVTDSELEDRLSQAASTQAAVDLYRVTIERQTGLGLGEVR